MDGLLNLTLPTTISHQDAHSYRFLNEFINYVCSDTNCFRELYYWNEVSRLLPLLDRCQLFLSILDHSHYNLGIQLVIDTCSKLLDFSISFLNFISNIEKSSSNEKLRIIICSFIHEITFLSPIQMPQFLDFSEANMDCELSSRIDIIIKSKDDVNSFDSSVSFTQGIPFRAILFQPSSSYDFSTNKSTLQSLRDFRASIIFHNRNYLQPFATSSFLLSIISSFSFYKSFIALDILFSVESFDYDVYFHEVLTLMYFTSIPEIIDPSPLSIQKLSDTCISALSAFFSQYYLDSTTQSSEIGSTHLFQSTHSEILRYALHVCDNFAMVLRFSHFPDYVERNFRLFQTGSILRSVNFILYPNVLQTTTLSNAHFDLSPLFIEIVTWIMLSVSEFFSQAKDGSSPACELFSHESNLFTHSTPQSRMDYLIDQSPLLSILFTLLVNGYSRCYASSAISTILESRDVLSTNDFSPIHDPPLYPLFTDLRSSLTFLLTSNIPIYGAFASYQQLLFSHVDSVSRIIPQYPSNQISKQLFFTHLFEVPNRVLRYYSQFSNIPNNIISPPPPNIPPPPPNIPVHFTSRTFDHLSPISLKLKLLDTLESSHSFNYSSISSYYMQFCCDILSLLRQIFLRCQNSVWRYFMNDEIDCAHVSAFCYLFIEITDSSYVQPVISPNCMLNFSNQLLSTFHCFLYSNFFNYSLQDHFLDNIGFKFEKWPLYLSEPKLFILSWLVLYHIKTPVVSSDHFSIRYLGSFITSLERGLSDSNSSFGQHHDVNYPHIQIFLFCFSSIPLNYRKSFLLRILHLLQQFSKQPFVTLASNLILCRVVSLLEYFLFHFTTPPQSLGQYIHSCFVENASFSITQKTPTSPFNDAFTKFILNTELGQLFADSILFEIIDRSNLTLDSTCLFAICNVDSDILLNYTDLYSSLLFHSFSFGKMSISSESRTSYFLPHLFSFRYASLKNILLHLPSLNGSSFILPTHPTAIDIYMILSFDSLCKSARLSQDLSLLLPDKFLHDSFLRPVDIFQLAESFFSAVTIPNVSFFHTLFISTSIIYLLYETMSILEQSMGISLENNTTNLRCNRSLIKFFLSDVSSRLIPVIFHVLHVLSNECSLYLSAESFDGSGVIEFLMHSCAVRSCSDDLTLFPSSSNPELFDSSLTESTKLALNSYYGVSISSFGQLSLFGDSFFLHNYSILDILESYIFSLTTHHVNIFVPIFKHCISTISSLLQHLLRWIGDEGTLSTYIPEVAFLIHKAPMISLFANGTVETFIPGRFNSAIRDASTSLLLKNSFYLLSLSQLRFFSNCTTVLNTYYTIMLQSVKDINIYRLICNILNDGSNLNFFTPLFLPIYPEFRNSLSPSIHTLTEIFIYQKENFIEESSVFVSQLNESVFLDQQNIFSYFDLAMLGYSGENEKVIEARCDKLLVLANAISTGCTILPVSTCQFILKSIIPLGDKLLDLIDRLTSTFILDPNFTNFDVTPDSSEFSLFSLTHPCLNSFLPIITGLAEVHNVHGELLILKAVLSWLPRCKEIVINGVKSKSNCKSDAFMMQFGTACSFLSDLLEQVKLITSVVKILMKREGFDGFIDFSCLYSECYDERIDIITSEENSSLALCVSGYQSSNSQICVTSNKQEANQHWYNCHTCNLIGEHGICTTCVKVCHKGHDLSYSRLSSIICSCGIKGKHCSCLLSIFSNTHIEELRSIDNPPCSSRSFIVDNNPTQRVISDNSKSPNVDPELMKLVEAIENEVGLKEELYHSLDFISVSIHALEILSALVEVNKYSLFLSSSSATPPIIKLFDQIHSLPKVFEYGEVLSGSILRSPEGIFENVKFSISEESLNPESLLLSFSVIRNSLCALSTISNMHSQYMLVALDKGKFTTIHRSSLIKSDSNSTKNKLNISKICNGNVPFTVIRMDANPLCENFVAFCGIRECCVVVLQSNGQVPEKSLPVQVGIEAPNYIVKAFWLPLGKTTLGIVTSQFIKLFDLSIDSFSPNYYFCMRSDYIVDSTYVSTSSMIYLYLMTHTGDVFYQAVSPQCVAENGPVFISSILEVLSDQSLNSTNRVQSGASIYYSHSLQFLFLSYVGGVNLVGSLREDGTKLINIVSITFKDSEAPVTLYEWMDSYLQPGFVCAFSRTTHSPILICIQTDTIYIHELKSDSTKSQLVGMALDVKSKHSSSEDNTSLILLFDDGSLKVHTLVLDKVLPLQSLSFSISPLANFLLKEKLNSVSYKCKLPVLPVDAFESCTICDDIEFGGTDVLHVYNQSQVKTRLSTEFSYIFNCKPTGFHIDVISTNLNNVFVGVRIKLGMNSILQSPTYVELFHRKIQLHFVNDKPRWFDIAFTREESIHSIRNFQVNFGPSKDSNFHSYVNSFLVYSKTKEDFGWKDLSESERLISKSNLSHLSGQFEEFHESQTEGIKAENEFERLVHLSLTLLCESTAISTESNSYALEVLTEVFLCCLDKPLKKYCSALIYNLLPNIGSYFMHTDHAILMCVIGRIYLTPLFHLTPEYYQQLLLNLYTVALNRTHNISILMDKTFLRRCCESFDSSNQMFTIDDSAVILSIPGLIQKIVSMFWYFYNKRPITAYYASVWYPGLVFIKETISIITGILYSFMVTDVQSISLIMDHIFYFVAFESDCIWEPCISALCSLLRPRYCDNYSHNTKKDTMDLKTVGYSELNDRLSSSLAMDSVTEMQALHENNSHIDDSLLLPNQNSGPVVYDGDTFSQEQNSSIPIEDHNIMNLALAISLKDQESNILGLTSNSDMINPSPDNPSSVPKMSLGLLSNVQSMPQFDLSTSTNIIAGEQSGDQSSNGTLTPPASFPLHDENLNNLSANKVAHDVLADNSSDQGGDTSPDDSESCNAQSTLDIHEASSILSDFNQYTIRSSPVALKKSNMSLYPSILSEILPRFSLLGEFGGFKAMHIMQLTLTLMSGIHFTETSEKLVFCTVTVCLQFLRFNRNDVSDLIHRTSENEATLIVIRFLSILLVREKKDEKLTSSKLTIDTSVWHITADLLSRDSSFLTFCFGILKVFIEYLKSRSISSSATLCLRSNTSVLQPSDIFRSFSSNIGKDRLDIFQNYEKVLIETIIRLSCQVKRICDSYSGLKNIEFSQEWVDSLSEYMELAAVSQLPGRRNVRKLLLYLAGSRENYRKLRDLNVYNTNLQKISFLTHGRLVLSSVKCAINDIKYDGQVKLLHCLSLCLDCAASRPSNWQLYCINNEITIPFLTFISTRLHEDICGSILHLICCAICGFDFIIEKSSLSASTSISTEIRNYFPNYEEHIKRGLSNEYLLLKFLNCADSEFAKENHISLQNLLTFFLLDVNSSNLRHLSLSFFWSIFSTGSIDSRQRILNLLWSLAEYMLTFGQKAIQFVELLSHCSYVSPPTTIFDAGYLAQLISLLKRLDKKIISHPNSNVYRILSSIVELDGYYLECLPCVICNNPEIPSTNLKLMSIKSDCKFTGNSTILKLSNSYIINSIHLKVTDIKRHKMVKTLKIYYSNRIFQNAIELKKSKDLCDIAREFTLETGQHEAKILFILPIAASNLIFEYSDFYEDEHSSPETLQCPRCSTAVPVHPGICGNCSENVFQCHKCRAINYDEKDAFLCNSCGFSKYGKFEYIVCAKISSSVDKINNEQERTQTLNATTNLLEKADQIYKQLLQHKQILDLLLIHETTDFSQSVSKSKVEPVSSGINKYIYMINQKYSNDCKSSFNELSKIIQGVLAGRHELITYDLTYKFMAEGNFSNFSHQPEDCVFTTKNSSELFTYFANFGSCYGCVACASKHCVSILMNLARNPIHKSYMIHMGLLENLCNTNLRIGTSRMQNEVRDFILRLNTDDSQASEELMKWLTTRIRYLIKHHHSHPNFAHAVYHEIHLLKSTMQYDDKFWEQRLRYMMRIFRTSICHSTVIIQECITLPCLKILLDHVYFTNILSCKYASMLSCDIYQSITSNNTVFIEFKQWLICKADYNLDSWKIGQTTSHIIALSKFSWLKNLIFHTSQHIRSSACLLVRYMMKDKTKEKLFIDLLFNYLSEVSYFGESAHDYLDLILTVFVDHDWRGYLSSKGILVKLGEIISSEVARISILEESTIHVDISLGYALKVLSTLLYQLMCNKQLTGFIDCTRNPSSISNISETKDENSTVSHLRPLNDPIFLEYKSMLLPIVFDVYLSMKRLVIQRTKRVDDAQEMTFILLELLTSGTFIERQKFVVICIEKLANVPATDQSSPVYILEEICSILSPEDFEDPEFFITFEKDPQQEEFLQGRMQNNPYNAFDASIGPLMRDVKNKICRDTELLALLEEDTGMELLVCNKIISLDLSVKEVYQKVWLSKDLNTGNTMKITYRMRGLLGEATEDMIEFFTKEKEHIEDEDKYVASGVMSQCGGLDAIIYRLTCLHDPLHSVKLLAVSLKLLSLCVKLQVNRRFLLKSSLNSIHTLLSLFTSIIEVEDTYEGIIGVKTLENILQILFSILHEASSSSYLRFNSTKTSQEKVVGDIDQLKLLFSCINNSYVQRNTEILKQTMKLIPYLTYGDEISMQVILDYFSRFLNFEEYDDKPLSEHSLYLDCFCTITEGISSDDSGNTLKDMILDSGIVLTAIRYILSYTPRSVFQQLSPDWDLFLKRPSLPFVLRFLGGICINHSKSQDIIADVIPNLHLTERATTSKGIGTLAENLLNNMVSDDLIYSKVIKTRDDTHSKQVHLAQEYQEKSLAELGITICDGKLQMDYETDATCILDESGLICCICMEGYVNHPRKILGIYTFFKCCQIEDFENISRKTQGYTSVSGFNVVHLDCHNTAIRTSRQSRGKEEWESASIHNSNIRCNSIMPVWGPEVQDNGYLSCLAKHHSSLQDSTGFRDPSFWSSVHDLKILILRYGFNISFSEESGGGSRFSNMRYICYYISYSFYLLKCSNSFSKEEQQINTFCHQPPSEWVISSYYLNSALYFLVASIFLLSGEDWLSKRVMFLERILIVAHSRYHSNSPISFYPCSDVLEYNVYRPYLIVYGIVTRIHEIVMKFYTKKSDNFILDIIQEYKLKDRGLLAQFESLIDFYEEDLLPSDSFYEFCDVIHILDLIPNPEMFLSEIITFHPNT